MRHNDMNYSILVLYDPRWDLHMHNDQKNVECDLMKRLQWEELT